MSDDAWMPSDSEGVGEDEGFLTDRGSMTNRWGEAPVVGGLPPASGVAESQKVEGEGEDAPDWRAAADDDEAKESLWRAHCEQRPEL